MTKRVAALLVIAMGCSLPALAQDKGKDQGMSKGQEMTGWLCDSKCVKQDAGKSACDASCTEKGGGTVFVDEQGKVTKVANPKMAKGKMGKKVTVHGEMMKDKDEMKVYDVVFANAG